MADLLTKDVQHISVDKLRCHPANPREGDVGAVWESIEQNGFFGALVVQKSSGHVLAGNHRLLAAREAGMDEVPVIYVDVDDEHAMRILLADNRTSDIATYDGEGLADLLEHLASTDDGLAGTGYDGDALDELLNDLGRLNGEPVEDPGAETDRADELREKWQTERGQLWQVGRHCLLCGDSTDAGDVERLLGESEVAALVTDPPYGIDYEYRTHEDADREENARLVSDAFELYSGGIIWTPGLMNLARDIRRFGEARVLVWDKSFSAVANGLGGASTWEPVLVVDPPARNLNNDVLDYATDRAEVAGESLRNLHSCPKPVGLYGELISSLTPQGAAVYDPFCGSGTTVIAAENEGRTCYAMEIDPAYCAVILERCTGAGMECSLIE